MDPKEGPDYFGVFTHELESLFSSEKDVEDDYFPFMGLKSVEIKTVSDGVKKSETLFCDGLGCELSDRRKEKLKGLLKQSVAELTEEVDQMVEVVLATCQLEHQLSKATASSSQGSASVDTDNAHLSKKHKKSTSPKGYLKRSKKIKSLTDILCQKEEACAYCNVTQTSLRRTPDGTRICNACGLIEKKVTLLSSQGKKDQTVPGSLVEVSDDLKFLLDNDKQLVEQTMKKYVDEISSSLGHMELQLDGFLDRITSKCRNMTFFEKQRLWKMIKDLPPKNFDRVPEIIRHGKELDQQEAKDTLVNLEDMDNTVLWRLYYYAKAVKNAQKLLA